MISLRSILRIGAALLSGVLFYFSLGLDPLWFAAWLAPIPILLAAFYSKTWREASLLTYLAVGIGISSNFTYYLKTTGPVATPILLLLQVLVWGFFVVRTRVLVHRFNSWPIVFAYPALQTGVSALVGFFSPHGTWGSYVYTQMDAQPVIQIASVFGAAGVVFIMGLFASAVAIVIYRGSRIEKPWLAYGLPAMLLIVAVGYGFVRLHWAFKEPTITIALVSIDNFIGPRIPPKEVAAVWDGYAEAVTALAKQGAKIVLLPEKIAILPADEIRTRQEQFSELARDNAIYLAAGVQLNRQQDEGNALWLFAPSGGLVAEYHKQQLVPYLEGDLTPGHEEMVRQIDGFRFGLAICRDLIFTDLSRKYGQSGVSAMLVPGWDFYVDAWMASSVAALRGVENGYTIVRAGRESYLNVSDRYGRVVARKRSDFLPGSSLIASVPMGPATPTLYTRFGNWFARLSMLGLFAALFPQWLINTREAVLRLRRGGAE